MLGEPVGLIADSAGRIKGFVSALAKFPTEPAWVVVGGFAVNVRVGQVHRLTNDLDTVSADQDRMIQILLASADADRLDHAKVRWSDSDPSVDIDVMSDTVGDVMPTEPSDRAFSLARRFAMASRETLRLAAVDKGRVVAECSGPVATPAALISLKAVAIPRRAASNHPEKVGSDIHDVVRLVDGRDLNELAASIMGSGELELVRWVGQTLVHWFTDDERYTMVRLRRLSGSIDARSLDRDHLAMVGELGANLLQKLTS